MEEIITVARKPEEYEKNVEMLMSIVSGKEDEADSFSRKKESLLYKLEAEEIDLKDLEAHALRW